MILTLYRDALKAYAAGGGQRDGPGAEMLQNDALHALSRRYTFRGLLRHAGAVTRAIRRIEDQAFGPVIRRKRPKHRRRPRRYKPNKANRRRGKRRP